MATNLNIGYASVCDYSTDARACIQGCQAHEHEFGTRELGEYRRIAEGTGYRVGEWRCHEPEPCAHEDEQATEFAIAFPVAGVFMRELEGRRELVDCTRIVFENAGEWYRVEHPIAGGDRCTVLTFSESLLESLLEELGDRRHRCGFGRQVAIADGDLYMLHRRLAAQARSRAWEALAFDELAYAVMRRALRALAGAGPENPAASRPRQFAVLNALELIHADYQRALKLDEIARSAGYSPFHFTRVFREHMGMPVHQYVLRLRLRSCYEALQDGESDLTSLALAHGFSSHSHFTHAFRREFGRVPSLTRQAAD